MEQPLGLTCTDFECWYDQYLIFFSSLGTFGKCLVPGRSTESPSSGLGIFSFLLFLLFLSENRCREGRRDTKRCCKMLSKNPETLIKNNKHIHVLVRYGWILSGVSHSWFRPQPDTLGSSQTFQLLSICNIVLTPVERGWRGGGNNRPGEPVQVSRHRIDQLSVFTFNEKSTENRLLHSVPLYADFSSHLALIQTLPERFCVLAFCCAVALLISIWVTESKNRPKARTIQIEATIRERARAML